MGKAYKTIRRTRFIGKHYGDDKATTNEPRNYAAGAENRPMKKLLQLMCDNGEITRGKACRTCVSRCRFGEEFMKRRAEGEEL